MKRTTAFAYENILIHEALVIIEEIEISIIIFSQEVYKPQMGYHHLIV